MIERAIHPAHPALAEQLGAPVALVSASKGEGIQTVLDFLDGAVGVPRAMDLPTLADFHTYQYES